MSRFFRGESDSESSSFSDSSYDSENETPLTGRRPQGEAAVAGTRFSRAAYMSESESEEDVKRVVRSAKDKRFDQLRSHVQVINQGIKANNWVNVSKEYDGMVKLVNKFGSSLLTDGKPPVFYIRCLVKLDDAMQTGTQSRTKINALQARAFNALKQKTRKNNKLYLDAMAAYRANPTEESEAESPEVESEPEQEVPKSEATPARNRFLKKAPTSEVESESESDEWPSESETETSESEDERPTRGIGRWLKKEKAPAAPVSVTERKPKKPKAAVTVGKREELSEEEEKEEEDDGFTKVGRGGKTIKKETYTAADIPKKLRAMAEARGKRNVNYTAQHNTLDALMQVAVTPADTIRILLMTISLRFDRKPIGAGYLRIDIWKRIGDELQRVLSILEENPKVEVSEGVDSMLDAANTPEVAQFKVQGSIIALVDRLDDEFTKSLQAIDPHTNDYLRRLRDQTTIYTIIVRAQSYFESRGLKESVARAVMRRVDHLYYKPDAVIASLESRVHDLPAVAYASSIVGSDAAKNPSELIHRLCAYLYQQDEPVLRTRAIICHIYNQALHDRFYAARDMMLMSHLQESIHLADISTQVLYNRALVQLGMCAFRQGLFKDSHSCLHDICNSGRQRELLAQGAAHHRNGVVDPERELLERQRRLPFHMHINLELIECFYLLSCMLLEIPAMARAGGANNPGARQRIVSKLFGRQLDYYERQAFSGPPETTRDCILSASRALAVGDWETCSELILRVRIWDLLPNHKEQMLTMITQKIKEEGMRTYLFTFAPHYDSLALPMLSAMFDLELNTVYRLASKMIWTEELVASLDRVGELIIFHNMAPSKVQQLSLTFSDKVSHFLDINERRFEANVSALQKDNEGEDDDESGVRRQRGHGGRGQHRHGGQRGRHHQGGEGRGYGQYRGNYDKQNGGGNRYNQGGGYNRRGGNQGGQYRQGQSQRNQYN
ncbi:Translation initiation factor 3 subunit c [Dispira simplex]|nr:Translation initiation factor 3 subunit c [Dispira simplex]